MSKYKIVIINTENNKSKTIIDDIDKRKNKDDFAVLGIMIEAVRKTLI